MAVAVKNSRETVSGSPLNRLTTDSWAGVAYLLGSLALVFYAVPLVWDATVGTGLASALGGLMNLALRSLVMLAAAVALTLLGTRLAGASPPHGFRAGILVGTVEVLVILLVTCRIGSALEYSFGPAGASTGMALTVVLGVALLALAVFGFTRPWFENFLTRFEDQGWFSWGSYKRNQGQRVRRGTILGILVLAGCGIYTLFAHKTLANVRNWEVVLPFSKFTVQLDSFDPAHKERLTKALQEVAGKGPHEAAAILAHPPAPIQEDVSRPEADVLKKGLEEQGGRVSYQGGNHLVLLPGVRFTLPILLALASLWIAYRLVNLPVFADFLVATEAELNKVSWTTRRRLIQDTIVVLSTVILLTVFLFAVDWLWATVLSTIGVVRSAATEKLVPEEVPITAGTRGQIEGAVAGADVRNPENEQEVWVKEGEKFTPEDVEKMLGSSLAGKRVVVKKKTKVEQENKEPSW